MQFSNILKKKDVYPLYVDKNGRNTKGPVRMEGSLDDLDNLRVDVDMYYRDIAGDTSPWNLSFFGQQAADVYKVAKPGDMFELEGNLAIKFKKNKVTIRLLNASVRYHFPKSEEPK